MSHPRGVILATLVLAAVWPPPSVKAQTNYENFTFTTLAGPQESPNWYDGTNGVARFSSPFGMVVDRNGNAYVADTLNHTIRKISPAGAVSTLAGRATVSGTNDGTGGAARFYFPAGLAVDTNGNVYVTDSGNNTIRKITPIGMVTTLAGSPTQSGTNNGLGGAAKFNSPYAVTVDTNGTLFVADTFNHTIRRVTSDGLVTTLAGSPAQSGTNNGVGSAAKFNVPNGVTVDTNGNLYVADTGNHTIRKITSAGSVTTLAGLATVPGTNNGTGGVARFNQPIGVTVDTNASLYVADYGNHTLRRVTSAGVVTTVAGSPGSVGSTDGMGSAARFRFPCGASADVAGNLYVADYGNHSIRKMTSAAGVTTLAGKPGGLGTADGTGVAAQFNYPAGVAVYGGTNIYVADLANHTIRKITPAGVVTTLAGLAGNAGSANGSGGNARFNNPTGVAVDGNGNVFVADTYNHVIRKITPAGSVSNLAGLATASGTNNGTGSAARFYFPFSVTVGTNGNVYVADTWNHMIRMVTPAGVVTTLAGSTNAGSSDGTGSAAGFYYPVGIAADGNGNLYVADQFNHTIRKITSAGSVTTFTGSAGAAGFADGTGANARFYFPFGVAVDVAGNIFVTEPVQNFTGVGNHTVRKITPAGVVTTLAGMPGTTGTADGTGAAVRFNSPEGIAVAQDGTLYLADTVNHSIRKGYAAAPDVPVVDLPVEKPGVVRQLDVANLTTSNWSWSIIRYPAASLALLSSTTNRNPTFTPDLADSYVMRFIGTDSQGRQVIRSLELVGSGTIEPRITGVRAFGANIVLTGLGGAPGLPYSVLVSSNLSLPMAAWTVLPGNTFDNNGYFTFTNGLGGSQRVYRLRVP